MPTISQRIALVGAAEIVSAFDGISSAVGNTLNGISQAFSKVALDKQLVPQFSAVRKEAEEFGAGVAGVAEQVIGGLGQIGKTAVEVVKSFGEIGDEIGHFAKNAGGSITATASHFATSASKISVAVAGIGGAVASAAIVAAGHANQIRLAAVRAGETAEEYQKLAFAFDHTGVGAERLGIVFAGISSAVAAAGRQGKESSGNFEKLGIALRDTGGHARSAEAILGDVAEKVAALSLPADQSALSVELFGRRVGPALVPLLAKGRAGIKELGEEAVRLGVVLSGSEIKAAQGLSVAIKELGEQSEATSTKFFLLFAPGLTSALTALSERFAAMQPAILGVGRAIVTVFSGDSVGEAAARWTTVIAGLVLGLGVLIKTMQLAGSTVLFFGRLTGVTVVITALSGAFDALAAAVGLANLAFAPLLGWALVVAAIGAAVVLLAANWDKVSAAVSEAWQSVSKSMDAMGASIKDAASSIGLDFTGAWRQVSAGAALLMDDLKETIGFKWLADRIDEVKRWFQNMFGSVKANALEAFKSVEDGAQHMAGTVQGAAQTGAGASGGGGAGGTGHYQSPGPNTYDADQAAAAAHRAALRSSFRKRDIQTPMEGAPSGETLVWSDDFTTKQKRAAGELDFSGGGAVRGPGTATSDSVPLWGSHGEFMIKAPSVRKYGEPFMHAVNEGKLRLAAAPGFALGGLISLAALAPAPASPDAPPLRLALGGLIDFPSLGGLGPAAERGAVQRFAAGGAIKAHSIVHLHLDGRAYELAAAPHIVDSLAQHSISRQSASAGQRPSWDR